MAAPSDLGDAYAHRLLAIDLASGASGQRGPRISDAARAVESLFKLARASEVQPEDDDSAGYITPPSNATTTTTSALVAKQQDVIVVVHTDETRRASQQQLPVLRLVFWLLEWPPTGGDASADRWRLLGQAEAHSMLQRLGRTRLDSELAARRLRLANATRDVFEHQLEPPRVQDDALAPTTNSSAPSAAFATLFDRFARASASENAHLYIALLACLLVLGVLCFATPAICAKLVASRAATTLQQQQQQHRVARPARRPSHEPPPPPLPEPHTSKPELHASWRKLSSSSTTLTRDESCIERRKSPVVTPQPPPLDNDADDGDDEAEVRLRRKTCAEWYTFEDSQRVWHTQVEQVERKSDTLSKSELIMVKEKLVPIFVEGSRTPPRSVANASAQTSLVGNYVNLGASGSSSAESSASAVRRDASSSVELPTVIERRVPASARARVDSIRAELARIEATRATLADQQHQQ